jgi:hypothetical protein
VVDAVCFTFHPEKSLTLTIIELFHRSSENLAVELRLGNA